MGNTDLVFHKASVWPDAGVAAPCKGYSVVTMQVAGTFVATIQFELTINGSDWHPARAMNTSTGLADTTTTVPGLFVLPVAGYRACRANLTDWTSGTVVVTGQSVTHHEMIGLQGLADGGQVYAGYIADDDSVHGYEHVNGRPIVSAVCYFVEIARGQLPGKRVFQLNGHNEDVGGAWESVSHISELRYWLTSPERLQVKSDDDLDTGDGTGARTVEVQGLDVDWGPLFETVTMDGQNNVTTDAEFIRVKSLRVVTAGETQYNQGAISISNFADDKLILQMHEVANMSQGCHLSVPAGFTAYILSMTGTEASSKGSLLSFWYRPFGELWRQREEIVLLDSSLVHNRQIPLTMESKTDFEIRAKSLVSGAEITASIEGWIEVN